MNKVIKITVILIFLMVFWNTAFNQEFPPPTNFIIEFDNDEILLSWEPPVLESLLQYNICYYGYEGGQITHIGSTAEIEYSIPHPTFLYSMIIGLSAEYINPAGQSDTIWNGLVCPWLWLFPMEIDFEDPEVYSCGMVANIMNGNDNWELTDTTSYSPDHCVGFVADSLNYKSALVTTVIESYDTESPALSFMYKIPQKEGKTDTLKLCYYSFGDYYLLTDSIYPSEEWQEYQYSIETLPNSFHFAFEATSGGGGGVFLDDILFYDNTVDVNNHSFDPSILNISVNQNCSNLDLRFTTKENTQFKLSIYSLDGRLVFNGRNKNLPKGMQEESIDISNINPGMYIVKLNLNDEVFSKKVFIR